jgi:NADH-quinone oxidoreductase subunit N
LENLNYIIDSLYLIKPEIAVSITICVLVLVDLIMHKNKKYLPYIAILGLVVTAFFAAGQLDYKVFASSPDGITGMIAVDAFAAFFKLIIIFASLIIVFFSISSAEIKSVTERHGEYYTLLFGMILGMFFMASAADLILIFVSLELVSLSSYVLAGFTKRSIRSSEASLKYIIYGSAASGIMLFGISILFGITGSTNLYIINQALQGMDLNNLALILSVILIFAGIGFKISAAPFHFWTPDVYEGAPVTITAYLSIASKAAGFALLIRFIKAAFVDSVSAEGYWTLLNIIDWRLFFVVISILTMTLGNFAALWQNNLKRMLAYSSIAHAGYLLLGLAVLSNQGLIAIMIYFAIYAFMNLGAFLVIMLIANQTGSEELDDYNGLGYSMPILGVSLTIFLVSLTGLPPTAGFIAKLYLFIALVDANMITVAVIALLNTVVSLYYYVRVLKHLYLKPQEVHTIEYKPSFGNTVLIMSLLVPVLVFGVYFTPLVELAKTSVSFLGF